MSSGLDLNLIFELVLAGLLVATIAYAAILDRKLGAIRKSKSEMESLIKDFAESTVKAEQGLAELRQHAGSSGQELQQQVAGASKLVTDLKFLVERGETLADRLESTSAQTRENLAGARRAAEKGEDSGQKTPQIKPSSGNPGKTSTGRDARKRPEADVPISERLNLTSENPGAGALLKALQRMR